MIKKFCDICGQEVNERLIPFYLNHEVSEVCKACHDRAEKIYKSFEPKFKALMEERVNAVKKVIQEERKWWRFWR